MKLILLIIPLFLAPVFSYSSQKTDRYRFNADLYGGLGNHRFIGDDIKENKTPLNVFYSLRGRYFIYKDVELEFGLGQSKYGTYVEFGGTIDNERTYNIPMLIRIPIKKHISFGLGAELNILNGAYTYLNREYTSLNHQFNDRFWSSYIDIKLHKDNYLMGLSVSNGLQVARHSPTTWNTMAVRAYIGFNLAELIRIRLLKMY